MSAENSHIYFNQTKEKDLLTLVYWNFSYLIYAYENNYYLYRSIGASSIAAR